MSNSRTSKLNWTRTQSWTTRSLRGRLRPGPKLDRKHKSPVCMAQKVSCQGVPIAFVALVGTALASVAGIAAIVAFIYRVFRCGVILDLHEPKVHGRKDNTMPRGSLLVIDDDGRQE